MLWASWSQCETSANFKRHESYRSQLRMSAGENHAQTGLSSGIASVYRGEYLPEAWLPDAG